MPRIITKISIMAISLFAMLVSNGCSQPQQPIPVVTKPTITIKAKKKKQLEGSYPIVYRPKYVMQLQKGTLQRNIQAFCDKYNWKLIWRVKKKYYVLTKDKMVANDFQVVIKRLLHNYNLAFTYDVRRKIVKVFQ